MVGTENKNRVNNFTFALTESIQKDALSVLFPEEEERLIEEHGFIGIINRSTGKKRVNIILNEIISQEKGWVKDTPNGLFFSRKYFSRALDICQNKGKGAGLIIVHSHFRPRFDRFETPEPSKPDLVTEREQLYILSQALPSESPVAAGIMSPNGSWRLRLYKFPHPTTVEEAKKSRFKPNNCKYYDASLVRIVGPQKLDLRGHDLNNHYYDEKSLESGLLIWGKEGQGFLSNLTVGIAGLGGVGSIISEHLARLGVGKLVLVDYDRLNIENLNRSQGATKRDLGKPKVSYVSSLAKKYAQATNFRVEAFRGSSAEEDGLKRLLDCDVVMSAADSPTSRQVLDHMSFAHLIPVIDGGTKIIVSNGNDDPTIGKSQVTSTSPGMACLECQGIYNQSEVTMAWESPDLIDHSSYVDSKSGGKNSTLRAPSVINLNAFVASVMVQRLLKLVLNFPPNRAYSQQKYYIEQGEMFSSLETQCKHGCQKSNYTALGDSHYIPTGKDPVWTKIREIEQQGS